MLLNTNVSLRPANSADWAAIASLLQANKLPLDGARDHLANYLVAVSNGEVVGSAGAEVYGNLALLRSVAVAPGLHKQGIGKLMVSRLLDEAGRRQVKQIFLLTVTAPEYFAQFGFKRGPIDKVPEALKASAEFQGACPACAALMALRLAADVSPNRDLPVAVLGAGPVGLAAAAKLLGRGMTPLVLESGAQVGANLLEYGHVRLFSPWRYNIDPAMAGLLEPTGWESPAPEELPTAGEVVERVLKPFAALPQMAGAVHTGTRVTSVSREGFDKVKTLDREKSAFVINAVRNGQPVQFKARAVIDATGTWNTPNPVGANGLPALGEREAADRIFYGIPDVLGTHRARYAGKRTLVVGAGHSAANALLALAVLAKEEPSTRLAWSVRTATLKRVFGGGAGDALPARGQLGTSLQALRDAGGLEFISGLKVSEIQRSGGKLAVVGLDAQGEPMRLADLDEIICATGQRPDLGITSELRLKLDPWLESTEALGPLIDPNLHSCGTVRPHGHRELAHPEPGFYTLGVKSYGRAPTFLMATGFEQARSVVAALDGDITAADRVELDLPETGVCSTDDGPTDEVKSSGSSCCGTTPTRVAVPAIAEVKASGGCGTTSCGTAPQPAPVAAKRCCG